MKAIIRPRKPKLNLRAQSFTLGSAKLCLEQLVAKASKGETVYIVRGRHRFLLQEVPEADVIPIRPAGYFTNCYSKAEIQEENQLAKASVIRVPNDLE